MKKLLGILVLGLLWCSNVYAASISDLLGSKKSLILKCTIKDSQGSSADSIEIGREIIYEIKGKDFYSDVDGKRCCGEKDEKITYGKHLVFNKFTITKEEYIWKFVNKDLATNKIRITQDLTISRSTGSFSQSSFYHKDIAGSSNFRGWWSGSCEKVADKKL